MIGLRFVVGDALGATEAQRAATAQRLERHVAELNGFYAASDVRLRAEVVLVDFASVGHTEALAVLEEMQHERGAFAGMFARAGEYGADYTIAVLGALTIRGAPGCGRGFAVNRNVAEVSSTRRAFAVVNIACGAHTLAHELGHLMGLNHGYLVDACEPGRGHTTAIAPYANGYAEGNCDGRPQPGEFGTIMVGGWMKQVNGHGHGSLRMFSNPRIRNPACGLRGICGDEARGDEARALNENARYYAAHEEPDVHTLRYASPALAACILERYRGVEIADLRELSCPGRGIEAVGGIERLTALQRVDLSGNRIRDASPLLALAQGMEALDLSGNPLGDCVGVRQVFDKKAVLPVSCARP